VIKYTIKDVEWSFISLPNEEYTKKYKKNGEEEAASTEVLRKEVFFNAKYLTKGLIAHELLHVYVYSCCIYSATNISGHDIEEICAEVIEYHLDDMVKARNYLWKNLK
jgi:hypothetical protein